MSRPGEPLNGTFQSPEFVNAKGHSRQCVFTFIAGPGQRVEIVFTRFALRGTPPESVSTPPAPSQTVMISFSSVHPKVPHYCTLYSEKPISVYIMRGLFRRLCDVIPAISSAAKLECKCGVPLRDDISSLSFATCLLL